MFELTRQDSLIDVEALLEELRNLPGANEYYTPSEPGSASLTKELNDIYSGFIGQFLTPDITTYFALYHWLAFLIEPGLITAEHRKQIVDILELASVVFESFVSVAAKLERIRDPLGNYPTDSCIRTCFTKLIDQCLASPKYSNDISPKLQKLKLMIEEREAVALASMASDTKWLTDLFGPEFNELDETWLSESIPDAALDIVAQGLSTAPISNTVSTPLPPTTAKLTRTYSVVFDTQLQEARTTRPLAASQSLNMIPSSDSRPKKGLPRRGVSLSRTQSLSTILPPQAQHRVMTALGTVTEE
ncbi:hypothetical protein AZE42_09154 [Rhizopogon vesiculosus]|uniref:Uncharacterized protein n=1 Tax=Rhizopogon vesiculosus TaxID=180088 RepID=A0A1J8PMP4_9AGAM|nr:hypothetical protein AZE42_09154 [Rhizopogon vesiculosus]